MKELIHSDNLQAFQHSYNNIVREVTVGKDVNMHATHKYDPNAYYTWQYGLKIIDKTDTCSVHNY